MPLVNIYQPGKVAAKSGRSLLSRGKVWLANRRRFFRSRCSLSLRCRSFHDRGDGGFGGGGFLGISLHADSVKNQQNHRDPDKEPSTVGLPLMEKPSLGWTCSISSNSCQQFWSVCGDFIHNDDNLPCSRGKRGWFTSVNFRDDLVLYKASFIIAQNNYL